MTPQAGGEAEAVERMFGAIAPRYDLLNRLLSAGLDRRWRRLAVREARLEAGARVLDVCAGTGDVALAAARRVPGAGRIVGLDVAAPMLALAAGKLVRAGLERRIALVRGSALALPFPAGAFDAVLVAFGIRNVGDVKQALAELARVARPGGRAVVLEFSLPPVRLMRVPYVWYLRRVLPWIGRVVSGHPSAYTYLPETVTRWPTPEAFAAAMGEAGFRQVRWTLPTAGIVALHVGIK
jgi:demethylmenaquinone methyltransferase/2-methoxy-6-polyprenyl-1,4-benzoquinol methylase